MTAKQNTTTQQLKQKKIKFLKYFSEVPVQKLAAAHIGMNEDSVSRWKKDDKEFAEKVERTKAEWVLKNVREVKDKQWLLEKLTREHFGKEETPSSNTFEQNNYYNLTDEQLRQVIDAKLRKLGLTGSDIINGEQDGTEPAEVLEGTQQTD